MEPLYQHILLAVDISANATKLLNKTKKLAELFGAKLTVLHAIERSPSADHLFVNEKKYEDINIEVTKKKLKEMGFFNQFDKNNLIIEFGSIKNVILNTAEKLHCDLIVVGSHGRHGLQKILGSTANAILYGATQDVFMIRYEE